MKKLTSKKLKKTNYKKKCDYMRKIIQGKLKWVG